MKLLVCVLNETRRLNDLLKAMAEIGVSGATVLESQGMAGVLGKETPVVAGLRHLVTQGRTFNYTIMSVLEDDEVADRTMKAIEHHLLPGTKAGTRGVAFTVQVNQFVRFSPFGQEVMFKGKRSAPSMPPAAASSFQRSMLAALKRAESSPPKLVEKLASGLKSLVEGRGAGELKEKRRGPRVECEYRVRAKTDTLTVDGRLVDLGIFGLSFLSPVELRTDTELEISPPLEVMEEAPTAIRCKVEQCVPVGDKYHCGLAYNESAETLTESWIAQLLLALGFDLTHLVQKRKQRRVPVEITAEFQTFDGELSTAARVMDLGVQGALVEAKVQWGQGTEIGLLLGPYHEHEAFYLDGVVVDVRDGEDGAFLHGVRFYPSDPQRMERLGRLLIDLLKNPAPRNA